VIVLAFLQIKLLVSDTMWHEMFDKNVFFVLQENRICMSLI
jgi:hypothetical protein